MGESKSGSDGGGRPLRVLFVCTANICRSAYAELMARHLQGPDSGVHVESAGTHGYANRPVDPPMAAQLTARGVEATAFLSRRLTTPIIARADLVLTAEAAHRQRVLEDHPEVFRRVYTLGQLARTMDEIGLASIDGNDIDSLAQLLAGAARPPERSDDVHDPYRRGEDAAGRAAAHLDELLTRILGTHRSVTIEVSPAS